MHPLTSELLEGSKFTFRLLRGEHDILEEFWAEWWRTYDASKGIIRPEIVADGDSILRTTIDLENADTVCNSALFGDFLDKAIRNGQITRSTAFPREQLQSEAANLLFQNCKNVTGQPVVFFMGGGYGSGKSSIASSLLEWGIPSQLAGLQSLVGVDPCKHFIPEYNILANISDGRASEICQAEARKISDELFVKLVHAKANFAWDSSLSDVSAAIQKMSLCRENGYKIVLIGILTDPEIALERAMKRAFSTRRFPPPLHFHKSHEGFRRHLDDLWDFSDCGLVLDNNGLRGDPQRLREKDMKRFGL